MMPVQQLIFFFNDTATTEIYTLSLHDALPISPTHPGIAQAYTEYERLTDHKGERSEEHTSELQSPCNLVCRLLLEKKKQISQNHAVVTLRYTSCPAPHLV